MATLIPENVVRRLLVSKHLLESNHGQLRPESDAVAVAQMILTAHDAVELAAATIAEHLGARDITAKAYLMEYPAKIRDVCPDVDPFPGISFVRQLNDARVSFKHYGNLPDSRTWYRVVENAWDWVNEWCRVYLGLCLEEINLEGLIEDVSVRDHFVKAREKRERGHHREALEELGCAVYLALEWFPGIRFPVLGSTSSEHALMLAPYGVRPSDFLNLQQFLPRVSKDLGTGELSLKWDLRTTGHRANWTDGNVDFCLATSLDLILKTQHAPRPPRAVEYFWIFDDVVEPKRESVDIWQYEYEGEDRDPSGLLWKRPSGRRVIRTLARGEKLRCRATPHRREDADPTDAFALFAEPTLENAEVLMLMSEELPNRMGFVEREKIILSYLPKENDFVRKYFPHLLDTPRD